MSVTLKEIFELFEFSADAKKHIPLVQLAALRGCFGEKHKDKLISDKDAILELLNTSFLSAAEGIEWWVKITQEKWLRGTFKKEGLSKDKDPMINVERWLNNSKMESKENDIEENQFIDIFNQLKLLETVKWPEDKITVSVVHGGMEEHASDRLSFIPSNFSGDLCYITNPRGLFNIEPSLAPILALWFGKSNEESKETENRRLKIQNVLNIHINDKLNWLGDLDRLKKEIMHVLGESKWPEEKGWCEENPGLFDKVTAPGKLKGWPTAMDMVEYLLKKRGLMKSEVNLYASYSTRDKRIANTADLVEDWYKMFGKDLPENSYIAFVSNNSKGLHYIPYQDLITEDTIKATIEKNAISKNLRHRIITVGPGAKETNLSLATDALARMFYFKREGVLDRLKNQVSSTAAIAKGGIPVRTLNSPEKQIIVGERKEVVEDSKKNTHITTDKETLSKTNEGSTLKM